MDKQIKKIWIKRGRGYEGYACKYPYTEKDIIKEGLPYSEWIKLETINKRKD